MMFQGEGEGEGEGEGVCGISGVCSKLVQFEN